MTVPQWMIDTIQEARELYGVGGAEWHITATLSDKPGGNADNNGSCKPDSVYKNAKIELHPDLQDDEIGRHNIHHEVFHIAHSEVDEMVSHIIDNVDEDKQDFYRGLYREVYERMVQTVTRSICLHTGEKKTVDE